MKKQKIMTEEEFNDSVHWSKSRSRYDIYVMYCHAMDELNELRTRIQYVSQIITNRNLDVDKELLMEDGWIREVD